MKRFALKVLILTLVGLALGYGYNWAAPRFYHSRHHTGFWLGALHGALMPIALPSLLLGKDAPIYADQSEGRGYKIGYIAGVDACGLLFFGMMFWRPRGSMRDA